MVDIIMGIIYLSIGIWLYLLVFDGFHWSQLILLIIGYIGIFIFYLFIVLNNISMNMISEKYFFLCLGMGFFVLFSYAWLMIISLQK